MIIKKTIINYFFLIASLFIYSDLFSKEQDTSFYFLSFYDNFEKHSRDEFLLFFSQRKRQYSENLISLTFNQENLNYLRQFDYHHKMTSSFKYKLMINDVNNFFYFKGAYLYELRKKQKYLIEYSTYDFAPFYFADTTIGTIIFEKYNFAFGYGRKFDNIAFAAAIDYSAIDGMKKKYSFSISSGREINLNSELVCNLDECQIHFFYHYKDYVENINTKDRNLVSVENKLYRGSRYFLTFRGQNNYYKNRSMASSFVSEFHANNFISLQHNIIFAYTIEKLYSIIPNQNFIEYNDGIACIQKYSFIYKNNYNLFDNLDLELIINENKIKSWSSINLNEKIKVAILEQNFNERNFGIILSSIFNKISKVNIQGGFSYANIDSFYYINSILMNYKEPSIYLSTNLEYNFTQNIVGYLLLKYDNIKNDFYNFLKRNWSLEIIFGCLKNLESKKNIDFTIIYNYIKINDKRKIDKISLMLLYYY